MHLTVKTTGPANPCGFANQAHKAVETALGAASPAVRTQTVEVSVTARKNGVRSRHELNVPASQLGKFLAALADDPSVLRIRVGEA
jgi:hypothetical protein